MKVESTCCYQKSPISSERCTVLQVALGIIALISVATFVLTQQQLLFTKSAMLYSATIFTLSLFAIFLIRIRKTETPSLLEESKPTPIPLPPKVQPCKTPVRLKLKEKTNAPQDATKPPLFSTMDQGEFSTIEATRSAIFKGDCYLHYKQTRFPLFPESEVIQFNQQGNFTPTEENSSAIQAIKSKAKLEASITNAQQLYNKFFEHFEKGGGPILAYQDFAVFIFGIKKVTDDGVVLLVFNNLQEMDNAFFCMCLDRNGVQRSTDIQANVENNGANVFNLLWIFALPSSFGIDSLA